MYVKGFKFSEPFIIKGKFLFLFNLSFAPNLLSGPAILLKSLFDNATLVESMLVALEHMQVSFVTLAWSTGLRKFRRNTISFPQDIAAFARRHGMMRRYQVGSRVNSARGPYGDAKDPARPARRAADIAAEDRELFAVDASGCMVYPATVREVHPDGRLLLDYDLGGSGYELWQNVRPRQVYPHSPRNVPLHLMLRRNVGRGRHLCRRTHGARILLRARAVENRRSDGFVENQSRTFEPGWVFGLCLTVDLVLSKRRQAHQR